MGSSGRFCFHGLHPYTKSTMKPTVEFNTIARFGQQFNGGGYAIEVLCPQHPRPEMRQRFFSAFFPAQPGQTPTKMGSYVQASILATLKERKMPAGTTVLFRAEGEPLRMALNNAARDLGLVPTVEKVREFDRFVTRLHSVLECAIISATQPVIETAAIQDPFEAEQQQPAAAQPEPIAIAITTPEPAPVVDTGKTRPRSRKSSKTAPVLGTLEENRASCEAQAMAGILEFNESGINGPEDSSNGPDDEAPEIPNPFYNEFNSE